MVASHNNIWKPVIDLIDANESILIIGHQRPDGDAIGSMTGLGLGLLSADKKVTLAVDGGTPAQLNFLPMSDKIQATVDDVAVDLVIFVDSSDEEITGSVGAKALSMDIPSIVLDHHVTNTEYADVNIVLEDAVSATDVVTRLFNEMDIVLTKEMATSLMYGILGDTRLFQYGPISGRTFATVQKLVDAGANINELTYQMRETNSSAVIILFGLALSRMTVEAGVAWTHLTLEDFERVGLEADGVIQCADTMLAAEDVFLGVELAEIPDGHLRMSLRAEDGYRVDYIAEALGGGGHPKAGGATLRDMTVSEAIEKIVPMLKEEYQNPRGETST